MLAMSKPWRLRSGVRKSSIGPATTYEKKLVLQRSRLKISGEDLEREQKWAEDKMYHAARSAWVKRNRRVPGKPYNWATWFENMFGENLFEYAKRMKGKKKAATSS